MRQRVLVGILAALVLLMLLVLFAAVSRDRDHRRAEELFAAGRFGDALGYFRLAEPRARGGERAEILDRIAICHFRQDQCEEARRIWYGLLNEYPDSEAAGRAKQGILYCLDAEIKLGSEPGGPAPTSLVQAQVAWRRRYNLLVGMLRDNRSGVPAGLEEAYRAYDESYKAYVAEIRRGLSALDAGGS